MRNKGRVLLVLALCSAVATAFQESRTWSDLISSMAKMHHAMSSIKPSGDNDIDFVLLMLPHHQAALDMARTELLHGQDPQIRRLAQEIVADQQSEIELMRLWVKQHGQGVRQ